MSQGNIDVDGEVDAGWDSYGVPEQNEGETVGGTTEEDFNEISTTAIPEEARGEDLDDQTVNIIEQAVINVDESLKGVAEQTDVSDYTVQKTLSRVVPEWYENTFKQSGRSVQGRDYSDVDHSVELMDPVTDEEIVEFVEQNEPVYEQELVDASELTSGTAWKRLESLETDGELVSRYEKLDESRPGPDRRYFYIADSDEVEEQKHSEEVQELIDELEGEDEPVQVEEEVEVEADSDAFLVPEAPFAEESPEAPFAEESGQRQERGAYEKVLAVCEYEMAISGSNHLAEHIASVITDEEGATAARIRSACNYASRRDWDNRLAEHIIDMV